MNQRKSNVLRLATTAHEMDLGVLRGRLLRDAEAGAWQVQGLDLLTWLRQFEGKEIVLIAGPLDDDRPVPTQVCRTCGREYSDVECPHCRDVRQRLRGRST
jgi:hypothetical protein